MKFESKTNTTIKSLLLMPSLVFIILGSVVFFANMHYYHTLSGDYTERLLIGCGFLLIGIIGIQLTSFFTRNEFKNIKEIEQ